MQLPSSAAVQSKSMLGRMDQRRRFGHICASAPEAPSPTETAAPEAARLDAAVTVSEWLKGTGGYVGPAQPVSTDAAAIGLRASGAIRRTEAVISVPQNVAITAETALRSDLGKWISEFEPELADFSFIALSLLHERRLGDQSELAAWLGSGILPTQPDVPLLWGEEDQRRLCGSTSAPFAERLVSASADFDWLEANAFAAEPLFFPESVFNKQAFTEAVALAFSRCVWLRSPDADLPALVPMLDLANHADTPNAQIKLKPASKGGLFGGKAEPPMAQLVALVDIAQGEPITLSYAESTRAELLIDYGFLQEPVPAEWVTTFSLDEDDINFDDKCDVLESAGLEPSQQFVLSEKGELPAELIAFLRVKFLKGADAFLLEALFRESVWREHLLLPVSQGNEEEALNAGIVRCGEVLRKFESSLQEDLALLAEAPRASLEYKLAALRYAERRAAEASQRAFKGRLAELSSLEYYQERRLRSLNLTPIETEEELDALREESARAAGRGIGQDYEW